MDEEMEKKWRMELAIKRLERLTAKIEGAPLFAPLFRGIPFTEFDKEHLVMLCTVFAEEWHKAQELYFAVLKEQIPMHIALARKTLYKSSLWRKIWNKIKSVASCTHGSHRAKTKTNAKA